MTEKVTKLVKGAIFGIVAGVFAVFALDLPAARALLGHLGAARRRHRTIWLGFLITGVLILILGAHRRLHRDAASIKKGSPPTPQLAIEEAQLIKGTLTASPAVARRSARSAPARRRAEVKR